MSNIDEIQDNIDSLVLCLFESIRNYDNVSNNNQNNTQNNHQNNNENQALENLTLQYRKTMNLIDNMLGSNRPAIEQLEEINMLQSEIREVNESITFYEENLKELHRNCQEELKILLSDENVLKQSSSTNS